MCAHEGRVLGVVGKGHNLGNLQESVGFSCKSQFFLLLLRCFNKKHYGNINITSGKSIYFRAFKRIAKYHEGGKNWFFR